MLRNLSFGVFLPNRGIVFLAEEGRSTNAPFLIEMGCAAEQLGFDSVWVGDSITAKPRLDPIATLGALATATKKARIGSSILLLALRHPVVVAHSLATIDLLSKGRIVVGVGVSSRHPMYEQEAADCGVGFKDRADRFEEAIEIMKRLWAEKEVNFQGKCFQHKGTSLGDLRTIQKPGPPVWIASGDIERGLRRVAKLGDGWFTSETTLDEFNQNLARIRKYAAEYGRDPSEIHVAKIITINASKDRNTAVEDASLFLKRYYGGVFQKLFGSSIEWAGAFGTPDDVVSHTRQYIDAGAETIIYRFAAKDQMEQLEFCAKEILPRF